MSGSGVPSVLVTGAPMRAGSAIDCMGLDVAARITRLVQECQACVDRAAVAPRAERARIARELADRLEVPGSEVEAVLLQALLEAVAAAFESFDAGAAREAGGRPPADVRADMRVAELRRTFLARVGGVEPGGAGAAGRPSEDPAAEGAPQAWRPPSNGEARVAPAPVRDQGAELADRAARLIERDFARRRTVADLARALHCHPRRLQECFRLRYHMSVHRYLDRVRAAEAARLIGQVGLKVEAAALMIGLQSRKNLYALIRRTTGLTVGEVRRAGGVVP
jgi:AraC-like DNA-binding protein